MSQTIQTFAIGEIAIRQHDGLFSLNDLHKASGGEDRHQPALFLRNDQAKALIEEIQSTDSQTAVNSINGGAKRGTYACRELVIAYAAWISAAFHLKVIRVFLAVTTDGPAMLPSLTPAQESQLVRKVRSITGAWLYGDTEASWAYNHLRVAFQVARWSDIPEDQFETALALLADKEEASQQFLAFITEARDWFCKNVMGGGQPWTPAIQRRLSQELGRRVILPPKVDWLALADQTKKSADVPSN